MFHYVVGKTLREIQDFPLSWHACDLQICECDGFHPCDFIYVIWCNLLEERLSRCSWSNHRSPLKAESFLWLEEEEREGEGEGDGGEGGGGGGGEVEGEGEKKNKRMKSEIQRTWRTECAIAGWKMGDYMVRDVATRSWEPSLIDSQQIFPRTSRQGLSPADTLILALDTLSIELSHTVLGFWPAGPWANEWVLLNAAKFVVIYYMVTKTC